MFEFEEMEDAEAFVSEVQAQFGKEGRVYDDPDEGPPVVFIDRVWAKDDAEAAAIKQRFGLTDVEIAERQKHFAHWDAPTDATRCAVDILAERKIDNWRRSSAGSLSEHEQAQVTKLAPHPRADRRAQGSC